MERLLEILIGIKEDIDFKNETSLIDDGILESLEILELISTLEETYAIEIGMEEIIPDNFNSMKAIAAMIKKLGGAV